VTSPAWGHSIGSGGRGGSPDESRQRNGRTDGRGTFQELPPREAGAIGPVRKIDAHLVPLSRPGLPGRLPTARVPEAETPLRDVRWCASRGIDELRNTTRDDTTPARKRWSSRV
jgi:hypothetical protein